MIATELAELVERATGAPLPVRLRAWDGSEHGQGSPTVVVRSPRALRRLLWHPSELGAAQAYVTGDLDIEGDLDDGLRRLWDTRENDGPEGSPSLRALVTAALGRCGWRAGWGRWERPPGHRRRRRGSAVGSIRPLAIARRSLTTTTSRTSSTRCCSTTRWCTRAATGRPTTPPTTPPTACRRRSPPSSISSARSSDSPPATACSTSAAAGAPRPSTLRPSTAPRWSASRSRSSRRLSPRSGSADWASPIGVTIRVQDYRDLDARTETFDAVSSLEMGEHVGEENYVRYAGTMRRMVKPGGRVLVQQMSRGETAPGGGAFIEAFIAPDMHMRPLGATIGLMEDAGLDVIATEAMREHYVRTIRAWHERFEAHWADAVDLVGIETARVWRLYLVGSALAFEQRRMGVDQILASRPR